MPEASIKLTGSCLGKSFSNSVIATGDASAVVDKLLPAAKVGSLTTRTDANTGTLTMSSGHGITTGAILDVYWSGGSRRGMTVGTVATDSVPIDGGSGDDLPAALTAITAMVPNLETNSWGFDGDDLKALLFGCNKPFTVALLDGSDAELFAFSGDGDAGGAYAWNSGSDVTNPVAGDTVAKVRTSHGDSTASRTVNAIAVLD